MDVNTFAQQEIEDLKQINGALLADRQKLAGENAEYRLQVEDINDHLREVISVNHELRAKVSSLMDQNDKLFAEINARRRVTSRPQED